MEMKKYKLENLCTKITDGSHYSPVAVESGYPMFSVKDMEEFGFSYTDVKLISEDDFQKMCENDCVPQKNDVLVAKDGSYLKEAFVCMKTKKEAILSSIAIFRPNIKLVNPYYLAYLFKTPNVYNYVTNGCVSGTALPRIVLKAFKQIEVFIPSLKQQNNVVSVLSSLDDKIALNKKINAKLEAMAKRLYDYWFVQFDFPNEEGKPYKSSGGKMEYNATLKRDIPAGWEVGNLYEIADYINGLACQNYRPQDEEIFLPVIKIKEMHEGITSDTEKVSATIPEKYIIFDGDILFSWSATLEVMIWTGGKGGLNQHIFKVVPKSYFTKEYVFQQLSSYIVNFQKMAEARKTTMGHITSDHINQSRIVIPPKEVINAFSEKTLPIFDYQLTIQKEIQKLTKLRDRLLPLLMNGQVEVE